MIWLFTSLLLAAGSAQANSTFGEEGKFPMGRGVYTKTGEGVLRLYCEEVSTEKLCMRARFYLDVENQSAPRGPELTIDISARYAVTHALKKYRENKKDEWVQIRNGLRDQAKPPKKVRLFEYTHRMWEGDGYYAEHGGENQEIIPLTLMITIGAATSFGVGASQKHMFGKSWIQDGVIGLGLGYAAALPVVVPLPYDLATAPYRYLKYAVKSGQYKRRRRQARDATPENALIRNFSRARNKQIRKMVEAFLDRSIVNWQVEPLEIAAEDFEAFSNVLKVAN